MGYKDMLMEDKFHVIKKLVIVPTAAMSDSKLTSKRRRNV